MTDTSMLLQCFLHVDRKGDPWVEEVSHTDRGFGSLVCTCKRRICPHIAYVAQHINRYRDLIPFDHTPAERREYVLHKRAPLTSGKSS